MAINSKCPKCEHSGFELNTEIPTKSNYKMSFIRCSSCGTVVGVTDYYNTGSLLEKLAKRMGFDIFG